jgi:hypothetical protein
MPGQFLRELSICGSLCLVSVSEAHDSGRTAKTQNVPGEALGPHLAQCLNLYRKTGKNASYSQMRISAGTTDSKAQTAAKMLNPPVFPREKAPSQILKNSASSSVFRFHFKLLCTHIARHSRRFWAGIHTFCEYLPFCTFRPLSGKDFLRVPKN